MILLPSISLDGRNNSYAIPPLVFVYTSSRWNREMDRFSGSPVTDERKECSAKLPELEVGASVTDDDPRRPAPARRHRPPRHPLRRPARALDHQPDPTFGPANLGRGGVPGWLPGMSGPSNWKKRKPCLVKRSVTGSPALLEARSYKIPRRTWTRRRKWPCIRSRPFGDAVPYSSCRMESRSSVVHTGSWWAWCELATRDSTFRSLGEVENRKLDLLVGSHPADRKPFFFLEIVCRIPRRSGHTNKATTASSSSCTLQTCNCGASLVEAKERKRTYERRRQSGKHNHRCPFLFGLFIAHNRSTGRVLLLRARAHTHTLFASHESENPTVSQNKSLFPVHLVAASSAGKRAQLSPRGPRDQMRSCTARESCSRRAPPRSGLASAHVTSGKKDD
jgi:hypothetical protein